MMYLPTFYTSFIRKQLDITVV